MRWGGEYPYTIDYIEDESMRQVNLTIIKYQLKKNPDVYINIHRYPGGVNVFSSNGQCMTQIDTDYIEDLIEMLDAVRVCVDRINNEIHDSKYPENIKIEKLRLSTKITNYLWRAGIRDVGTLCKMDFKKLQSIRGIGEKALAEISTVLTDNGQPFDWEYDYYEWRKTKETK